MARLTPQQRASRLRLDWQVVQSMNGPVFEAIAYRSVADLERQRDPITTLDTAHEATAYHVTFRVPTLAGRGKALQPVTTIGFNLAVTNYPYDEPASWVIGPVPYSPHFKANMPVCTGELWREGRGRMLFGQLLVHVAKLLNWDEKVRGGGYVGWNADAIAYHRQRFGDKPITPDLVYPTLPAWLTHGLPEATSSRLFGPASDIASGPGAGLDPVTLFSPAGGR